MKYKSVNVCFLLLLSLHITDVYAAHSATPAFHLNGYGTLGMVHSSEDQADFRNSLVQPDGAGHSHDWTFGVDSRVGVQLTADINERLTAVVQVVSEQRYDGNYTPFIEWANIKYNVTPDFSVRVGRIVLPVFMVSDYRKVGYANPWVRPPAELYGIVPVTSNDGIDTSYRFHLGALTNTLQAFYGRKDFSLPEGTVKSRGAVGVYNTIEFGDATLRGGYLHTHVTIPSLDAFFDQFRQFGPEGTAIADSYDFAGKRISLWTLGGSYDPGDWFIRVEWLRSNTTAAPGTKKAWYATGGYRFGEFTPYAGYAQRSKLSNASDPGLNVAALPPPLQVFATGLNAGLNSFLSANDYDTLTIGTRWDFMDNVNLKLQLDHIRLDEGSIGGLINIQPGFQPGGHVNVFSATIDFVF